MSASPSDMKVDASDELTLWSNSYLIKAHASVISQIRARMFSVELQNIYLVLLYQPLVV